MTRRPPRSTPTATLFPYTTLFRSLSPAVRRILTGPVVHHQIARDIASRMPQVTHRGDEDMRMVLAHAAGAGERLLDGRLGVGDPDPVGQLVEDQRRQGMRPLDVVRSEERRVGKEGVSTCRSRWSPYN